MWAGVGGLRINVQFCSWILEWGRLVGVDGAAAGTGAGWGKVLRSTAAARKQSVATSLAQSIIQAPTQMQTQGTYQLH